MALRDQEWKEGWSFSRKLPEMTNLRKVIISELQTVPQLLQISTEQNGGLTGSFIQVCIQANSEQSKV